jgi:hypothetical protein
MSFMTRGSVKRVAQNTGEVRVDIIVYHGHDGYSSFVSIFSSNFFCTYSGHKK